MTTVFHSQGEGELRQVSEHQYLLGAYRTVQGLITRGYIYCADRGGWSFIETWKFNNLRDSEAGAQ